MTASVATRSTIVRFVDTNVLLYAHTKSDDPEQVAKAERARQILKSRDLALSVQVLQEFYVQATRESRRDRLRHDQAVRLVQSFRRFPVQELTVELVQAAFATRERFRISYWDASILEAARCLECDTVLSEDLNHGQDYGGVLVVDPFR